MADFTKPGIIDQSVVDKVGAVTGVAEARGTVVEYGVIPIDTKGKAVTTFGPPQLGMGFHTLPSFEGNKGGHVVEGHEPTADDQVALDPQTLRKSGHAIGDRIRIITPAKGTVEFTVVGTATSGSGSTAGATYAFFTTKTAHRLFTGGKPVFTNMWVVTEKDADRAAVATAVQKVLPEGYRAQDGKKLTEELTKEMGEQLKFVNVFVLVFAGIALLVASFLIVNTFNILVAQRSKELALYRALGASRGQIRLTVLGEALALGLGRNAVVGVVLTVVGAACLLAGAMDGVSHAGLLGAAGIASAMVGVAIASPLLGRPVVWLVGKLYSLAFGEVGRLATVNSVRQPRRTAATASALMVGLCLVSMIAIFARSATVSVTDQVAQTVRGDFMVGQAGFQGFPSGVAQKAATVEQVDSVHLKPGADKALARQNLDKATADMPLVSVMDLGEYTEVVLGQVNKSMAMLYALLGLSIIIAVLGIVNTLGLSIVERRREIGLLRSIALTRAHVRRMITLESIVISLLGALVGVGLGTVFGVALRKVMSTQGIDQLAIPWGQLAVFVGAAVVVGVLAALWPAHRAARTDILKAIAAE